MEHTVAELKEWLGKGTRKVESKEMMDFWKSLSDEEKKEFKNTDLP